MRRLIVGVAAGLLGGFTANLFTRAVAAANGGCEAPGAAPGPRRGHGMQPAQAGGHADRDATVKVGAIAYRAVTGHEPSRALEPRLGTAVHYAFSAGAGACYVA